MRGPLRLLLVFSLLAISAGCGGKAAVEGKVEVTSTDPFKKLHGNPPQRPVMPPASAPKQ
jgi:hypothetical protein